MPTDEFQLKVVSWNLGHRTREKVIDPKLTQAIALLTPDILILNEFVDGSSRHSFKDDLENLGLMYQSVSPKIGKHNQILIASKFRHSAGKLLPPQISDAARTNFLHRFFPQYDLDIVGVRVPYFKTSTERSNYWFEFSEIVKSVKDQRAIFMGDFNVDPARPGRYAKAHLSGLLAERWQIPVTDGAWSFISIDGLVRTRLDHVICSSKIRIARSFYSQQNAEVVYAGSGGMGALSDHAPLTLVIEVDVQSNWIVTPLGV